MEVSNFYLSSCLGFLTLQTGQGSHNGPKRPWGSWRLYLWPTYCTCETWTGCWATLVPHQLISLRL